MTTPNIDAVQIRRVALKDAENIARLFDLGTPDGHAIGDAIKKYADAEFSATATPQADAAPVPDEIVQAVQAYGDARADSGDSASAVARVLVLVRAAIAAGEAQEPVAWKVDGLNGYNESAPGVWFKKANADEAAAMLFKSSVTPLYAAPLPREVATVWLTDEQRTAIAGGAAALRKIGGFDSLAEELDGLRAAAANGEQ